MAGFRRDPLISAYSGGTVHESHMVHYSSSAVRRCLGHCGIVYLLLIITDSHNDVYGFRFSDLPRTFHDQGLALGVGLPRIQKRIDLPLQIHMAHLHASVTVIIRLRKLIGQANNHEFLSTIF